VTFPLFWHQDAREVGVVGKQDTKKVERFSLKGLSSGVDGKEGIDSAVVLWNLHTNAYALALTHTEEIDDNFKALGLHALGQVAPRVRQVVHSAEICAELKTVVAK
jgi:hypothetical protein